MKIKTADLIRPALDWAVGTALELPVEICQVFQYGRPNGEHYISIGETDKDGAEVTFEPSEEWSQGGPILEQEGINLFKHNKLSESQPDVWCAHKVVPRPNMEGSFNSCALALDGPTPLVAAMRCFVASRFGDEVDIPEELLT